MATDTDTDTDGDTNVSENVSENERWFDDEIAPALAALGNRCRERGMAFVATVEYEPGSRSSTIAMPDGAGLAMQLLRLCANAGHNLDGYLFAVKKFCDANGVPTDSSIVMRQVFDVRR